VTLLNLLSFPTEATPDAERYQSLLTYLDELLSVKEEQSAEIVKFLQAILDKLIDLLLDVRTKYTKETNNIGEKALEMHSKQIQPRVFDILVAIFQIIENQNKFASFRTVMDAYLSKNFCITLAHRPLLRIFYEHMSAIYDKYNTESFNKQLSHSDKQSYQSSQLSLTRLESNELYTPCADKETENGINIIKSMEYIFKFAFRSRELLALYNK
jgi:hypothetical protein